MVLLGAVLLGGCFQDDYVPGYVPEEEVVSDDTASLVGGSALVGEWVSEGADLSELFANPPFEYVRVEARFEADGDYRVVAEDGGGTTYPLVGSYEVDEGTSPPSIVLTQDEPYAATARGIWKVDGGVLTYEIVQTVPDYGYTPPTPATGFGSTTGPGLSSGDNVQTYR